MKIYSKYVLFSVIKSFFSCLLPLLCFLMLVCTVEAYGKYGASPSFACKLCGYLLIEKASYLLIGAAFVSSIATFVRLKKNHELIALRAMGIAPWIMMRPLWFFMGIISVISIFLTDSGTPWGQERFEKTLMKGIVPNIVQQLKTKNVYSLGLGKQKSITIKVDSVDDKDNLINPIFTFTDEGGTLNGGADSAKLNVKLPDGMNKEAEPKISIETKNFRAGGECASINGIVKDESYSTYPLPLNPLIKRQVRIDPRIRDVFDVLTNIKKKEDEFYRNTATNVTFSLLTGDINKTNIEIWEKDFWKPKDFENKRNRCLCCIPKILSLGFACLFISFSVAPFVVWLEKDDRDLLMTVFLSSWLLVLFLVIYNLSYSAIKDGSVPPYVIFFPDIALLVIGYLFLRTLGYGYSIKK